LKNKLCFAVKRFSQIQIERTFLFLKLLTNKKKPKTHQVLSLDLLLKNLIS